MRATVRDFILVLESYLDFHFLHHLPQEIKKWIPKERVWVSISKIMSFGNESPGSRGCRAEILSSHRKRNIRHAEHYSGEVDDD